MNAQQVFLQGTALPADPSSGEWVARCMHRLRQQWPHAELISLEEAAVAIWQDPALHGLAPEMAAEHWLAPLLADRSVNRHRSA